LFFYFYEGSVYTFAGTDLLTCDVSYAHWHDILHIDPTLLEDREIVYNDQIISVKKTENTIKKAW